MISAAKLRASYYTSVTQVLKVNDNGTTKVLQVWWKAMGIKKLPVVEPSGFNHRKWNGAIRAAPYRLLIASKLANEQQGAALRIADGIDKRVVGNEVDITIVSRTE